MESMLECMLALRVCPSARACFRGPLICSDIVLCNFDPVPSTRVSVLCAGCARVNAQRASEHAIALSPISMRVVVCRRI